MRLRATEKKQRACYSGKKKHHTLKAQVLLEHGTRRILCVRVGKGRRRRIHANTRKPTKATKKHPLTREQKRANRQINSRRIVVEHAIRRLKVFRLLGERYRNRRKRFGLRLNLIAALTNLQL